MDKLITELIGTFFLVLTIGMTAGVGHGGELAPLAIGCVLVAMIFAGGHISGAHYNPAVTFALWLRGHCQAYDVPGYLGAQLGGAVLGALAVGQMAGDKLIETVDPSLGSMMLAEVLFTFALVWVILNVAAAKGTEGNSFYGLAIGFTVTAGIFAVGPVSGAVFNPAVAVGLSIMGLLYQSSLWIYFFATTLGAALAAFTFGAVVKD